MYMNIEIIKPIQFKENDPDGFYQERWVFILIDQNLYVDKFMFEHRQTKRHKWEIIHMYSRLNNRNSENILTIDDLQLTDAIKAEAKQKLMDMIVVKLWNRE